MSGVAIVSVNHSNGSYLRNFKRDSFSDAVKQSRKSDCRATW